MKKVTIRIDHTFSSHELREMVLNNDDDELINLVALIDLSREDWGFTERLITHFKALEIELMKECPDDGLVEPKKINVKR